MLTKSNTQAFMRKLKKDGIDLTNKVNDTHRRICRHIFTDLVKTTPQYTGNLARNWTISFTGTPPAAYQQSVERRFIEAEGLKAYLYEVNGEIYQAGDDPAVGYMLRPNGELAKIAKIRYNTIVTFTNTTPYAEEVAAGYGPNGAPLRPENQLQGYGGAIMTNYIEMKYRDIRNLRKLAE